MKRIFQHAIFFVDKLLDLIYICLRKAYLKTETQITRQMKTSKTTKEQVQQESAERAVLVTTAHKGVFFGYTEDTSGPTIKLRSARNCVYWSTDLRGFMGLAAVGPNGNCKIGPRADIERLADITAIVACTPAAIAAWEKAEWKG